MSDVLATGVHTSDKSARGNASQFFVAGELCRRGYSAVVTLGNTPNTDILCSNLQGTRFVHIQVKTFVPGSRTCSVGLKAERNFGDNFFWVLSGIPEPKSQRAFEYYVIPQQQWRKMLHGHISSGSRDWEREAKFAMTARSARCICHRSSRSVGGTSANFTSDGI
jgi:hypothetical protein